jgi:hypothetical protein
VHLLIFLDELMPAVRVLGCIARGYDVVSGRSEDPHESLLVVILDGHEKGAACFFCRREGLLPRLLSHGKLGEAAHPDREEGERSESGTIVPMQSFEVVSHP